MSVAQHRHCWPQDVTSEEGYNGESSGPTSGSPVLDGGLQSSSHISCQQEGELIRDSEEIKQNVSQPVACTNYGLHSAVLCSQPKRGALRRQARIDPHAQEQLQDPWVRISDSLPEELTKIHHRPCKRAAQSTQPINVHNKPAATSAEHNMSDLSGAAIDEASEPPSNTAPGNISETPLGAKLGPPVAPKPAWFRRSLRKIEDEQELKKQAKPTEERTATGFNRSFGARSAAKLSMKQKIHSFETFSNPEVPEKGGIKRPLAPSNSLPQDKDSKSPPASHREYGDGKYDIPKEIQAIKSESVRETNHTLVPASPSAITFSSSEACSETPAESPEDQPPSSQSFNEVPLFDTISAKLDSGEHDFHSAQVDNDRNVFPTKQEPELERVDLTEDTECKVLPSVTSIGFSKVQEESFPEGTEEDGAESQGTVQSTTLRTVPPADTDPLGGLEEESLGKILAFSNQVSQALMRSLPIHPRQGNPRSLNAQDSSGVFPDPQGSEYTQDTPDRGFSVSLATLRECTIERGEEGCDDEAAVTCAHSVISAIPTQEIHRMIQEVNSLDEETLKQLAAIHVVILHKEEGAGLGFSIAGGSDLENTATTVHRVFPSGLAAQEGTIEKGDEVLSINGQTLHGLTHADATAALRQSRSLKQAVVVVCKRAEEDGREGGGCRNKPPSIAVEEQGALLTAELEKGAGGVGFTLEGGKGSIHGDRPLVINRIFQGGAAEQNGLQHGDELLQVQGTRLQDMTRFEAWNMIKTLPEGPIVVVIRRGPGGEE